MALKVAPLQCRWPWVKHMLHLALKYSNEALALEPDNVKARSLVSTKFCIYIYIISKSSS
ncbi:unnamed protein product [Durusdinium trenchii]|uniref:Uncharacterized protein n=1 Tax=Durusdinium trenchii TaxID=1381693 RepID=A0ABP0PKP2_9DINO